MEQPGRLDLPVQLELLVFRERQDKMQLQALAQVR